MNREEVLYLIPYIFSLLLSLGIFVYTRLHRQVRGARIYAWFVGGQVLTILGFIFELISPNLQIKIFWDKFQWFTDFYLVILPFLIFVFSFSEYVYPKWFWGIIFAILGTFTILLLTDNLHHLIYPNPHLSLDYPFPELEYDLTGVIYLYAIVYVYGANFYGIGLLLKRALSSTNIQRVQFLIVAVGFSIPVLLSILSLLNIRITPQRDNAPFALAIGNLVIAWGLFRFSLFDIAPIARERIVENMRDPVIVLDPQNRIVDLNRAALELIGKGASEVIRHHYHEAFARWPFIVELLDNPEEQQQEVAAKSKGETFYFDINISHILNKQQELIGRIVVARDITRHKYLEINYRALSEELEQRVHQRTEELRESAERYRALVENQTEFIVRWTPDGRRTFVNEAYCRYFGITVEQALASNFLSLILQEDRSAFEEKIYRLKSGLVNAETDIHRVVKSDGKIGWQEWTDQAIHDEAGNLIEFQSVGRDISQRKEAEEALRKSEERFSKAFQASPIIITISRVSNATLLEVNETFEKISGYTREEVIERSTLDLNLWSNTADRDEILSTILANGEIRNKEIQFRIKNGTLLTCLLSGDLIEIGGEKCVLATIEDISERKKAEERILHLNRLYVTINQINQTIVHVRDRETLFKEICRVTIEHGQFWMAWIGLLEKTNGKVHPLVFAGEENGYLEDLDVRIYDAVQGQGPTGTTIREGRCIISQDISNDLRMIPWREQALLHGYRSAAAVPLREHGKVVGALTVYANEVHAFNEEDEALLEQIGQDVSFALDSIEAEFQREIAERHLAEAYDTTLEGWAKALELRDKETEGHSRRVTKATLVVARAMGFDEEALVHIRRGSILHDIGKMGIPDEILRKSGSLTEEERAIVVKHPRIAFELLKSIPFLEKALDIPYSHHEKWDGSGYPCGLKGEEIPLAARIFAVVDVWDALCSDRSYRSAWSQEKVIQYLKNDSAKHFDPEVLDVFLQLLEAGKI